MLKSSNKVIDEDVVLMATKLRSIIMSRQAKNHHQLCFSYNFFFVYFIHISVKSESVMVYLLVHSIYTPNFIENLQQFNRRRRVQSTYIRSTYKHKKMNKNKNTNFKGFSHFPQFIEHLVNKIIVYSYIRHFTLNIYTISFILYTI